VGTSPGGSDIASAGWNGAGEATSYQDGSANMSAASYDGDGVRTSATFGSGTQSYVWGSASTPLMDSTSAFIYDDGGTPLEQVNLSTGAAQYLVTDAAGSVRAVISPSGSVAGTTSYDAFGNPQTQGGLTASTPLGFEGGYTDPTGLILEDGGTYSDPQTGSDLRAVAEAASAQTNSCSGFVRDAGREMNCSKRKDRALDFLEGRVRGSEPYHQRYAYIQASAIVGNLMEESGNGNDDLSPWSVERKRGCSFPSAWTNFTVNCGVGIAGWTLPFRIERLKRWSRKRSSRRLDSGFKGKTPWLSFKIQLHYLWFEAVHYTSAKTGCEVALVNGRCYSPIRGVEAHRTLYWATQAWMARFEGPGAGRAADEGGGREVDLSHRPQVEGLPGRVPLVIGPKVPGRFPQGPAGVRPPR